MRADPHCALFLHGLLPTICDWGHGDVGQQCRLCASLACMGRMPRPHKPPALLTLYLPRAPGVAAAMPALHRTGLQEVYTCRRIAPVSPERRALPDPCSLLPTCNERLGSPPQRQLCAALACKRFTPAGPDRQGRPPFAAHCRPGLPHCSPLQTWSPPSFPTAPGPPLNPHCAPGTSAWGRGSWRRSPGGPRR